MTEDIINKPKHYQPIKVQLMQILGIHPYDIGNAMKYWYRAGKKNSEIEDLKKAKKYLQQVKEYYPAFPKRYDDMFYQCKVMLADTPEFAFIKDCWMFENFIAELETRIDNRIRNLV